MNCGCSIPMDRVFLACRFPRSQTGLRTRRMIMVLNRTEGSPPFVRAACLLWVSMRLKQPGCKVFPGGPDIACYAWVLKKQEASVETLFPVRSHPDVLAASGPPNGFIRISCGMLANGQAWYWIGTQDLGGGGAPTKSEVPGRLTLKTARPDKPTTDRYSGVRVVNK